MENGTNSIPNEAGVESVDTSNVVESAPAWTSQTPQREAAPAQATEDDSNNSDENGDNADANANASENTDENNDDNGDAAATNDATYQPQYTPEQIVELAKRADYQPAEVQADFVDELGNFDPQKFGEFMRANNENVFNQAIQAANARTQLTQIETDTWGAVESKYPEITENPTIKSALRGARTQDVINGGDGDLERIAADIIGPMRQNKIDAVESVNRQVTEQKKLETFTPTNAAPDRAEPSLMSQLKSAVANGESEKAKSIRHAIRKERINANNS